MVENDTTEDNPVLLSEAVIISMTFYSLNDPWMIPDCLKKNVCILNISIPASVLLPASIF